MKYISTRKNNEQISFREAVVNGLSNDGGLYVPKEIPKLPSSFFKTIEDYSNNEIAYKVLHPFVQESLNEEQLMQIIEETLSFPIPLKNIEENIFALELFHGPTQAFKDVGARFMSRCLSHFKTKKEQALNILVATSGDTGSAVANGFFNVPNVAVTILFPKGKVSPYQEYQMTSLGKNIYAIEVEGTFDDCQQLVKKAFTDIELKKRIKLSSANSINIARLLPQMLYYFFAYKQLKPYVNNKKVVVSVPSGNLGNITAGLFAQQMGLPVSKFIAALNTNDTFLKYLTTGIYQSKPSVLTYSNAMDVGNPSNFERILHLYQQKIDLVRKHIAAYSFSDTDTLEEIMHTFKKQNYLLDPHGAIGKLALSQYLDQNSIGLFLGTAHPQKFSEVIQKVIPEYVSKKVDLSNCNKQTISNSYQALKKVLL